MLPYSIQRLVAEFESNPPVARRRFQEAWECDPTLFFAKAVEVLSRQGVGAGQKYLVTFLIQYANLEERLGDPELMTREESLSLARLAMRVDPSLDIKLAHRVASSSKEDDVLSLRLLEVLESVAEVSNVLPILGHVLRHPDEKVRSKAALLIGKGHQNPGWVLQMLADEDPRVRANAVETLWGLATPDALDIFRRAVQDGHQRVAMNAALGLYFAGKSECLETLFELARHHDPRFRLATAWGLGRSRDPRFLRVLTELARDADNQTRATALRSTVKIRNYRSVLEGARPHRVHIMGARITETGMREVELSVTHPDFPQNLVIPPLSFVLEEDSVPVARYDVQPLRPRPREFGIVVPAPSDLSPESAVALDGVLRRALATKPELDSWATMRHTHTDVSRPAPPLAWFQTSSAAILDSCLSHPIAGFLPAVRTLLDSANTSTRRNRAIILLASSLPESTSIVLLRQHETAGVVQQLVEAGFQFHAIVSAACTPLLRAALADLCTAANGQLHVAGTEMDSISLLEAILQEPTPTHRIRYWGFPRAAARAQLRVSMVTPNGLGESTTIISAALSEPVQPQVGLYQSPSVAQPVA